MLRKIIFDQSIDGHHLEYINHLYCKASVKKDVEYYFILHPDFENKKEMLSWPHADNISIDFFSENELDSFKKNSLISSFYLSKALKKRIVNFEATDVFLINLISFLPFIIFFVNSKIRVSGIIYLIYLYRWKKSNWIAKLVDVIKYIILSKSRIFDKVFLLNDQTSPRYLNYKFKTKVFTYLPDPIFIKNEISTSDHLKEKLKIGNEKKVCLHFGALNKRKGTIEILKAINEGEINNISQYCFIFAGKVGEDIKQEFYQLSKNDSTQILIFDEYCSYDFLSSLCAISDYILIPYKVNEQSSGILNYAAIFNKPLMGIKDGLIGKIISKYKLGFLIEQSSSDKISAFLNSEYTHLVQNSKRSVYITDNSVKNFQNIILE